ncbi:pentapeptide repeat-containing protein [Serratia marcescens]|uniref:ion channel n=1 Tax=Serratia marcescens TaxID=615 RepID=UPI001FD62A19|nr:ion channel [Serratia marcescens]UOO25286.1 pentapeptide repeat-containing protein [Serratia marcescens]HBB9121590.1 pentapeptide repeat-containing protein [Serratia marcescens]
MAANFFSLNNNKDLHSQDSFIEEGNDFGWVSINYFPDFFGSSEKKPLVIRKKEFHTISFKDTSIENVNFINCYFYDCLFIGSTLKNCEFIDCQFHGTNTHKIKIESCLIDPRQFSNNFELKYDANIAVDLFQELYKNSKIEEQPKYAIESLYQMKVALGYNLNYKYKSKKIDILRFFIEKSIDVINKYTTGYGLKISRIFATLLITIFIMAMINLIFRSGFTTQNEMKSIIDAIYFTCITVTTLGYGDITPITGGAKIIVIFEALVGFVFMSLFVSAFVNRILRV